MKRRGRARARKSANEHRAPQRRRPPRERARARALARDAATRRLQSYEGLALAAAEGTFGQVRPPATSRDSRDLPRSPFVAHLFHPLPHSPAFGQASPRLRSTVAAWEVETGANLGTTPPLSSVGERAGRRPG